MRMAVRLLFMVAVVGLVAGPVQAHTIAVRGGGGSTDLCGDFGLLNDWTSLAPDEDDPDGGQETILNNCDESIFSLDIQLSDDGGESLSHPPDSLGWDGTGIFDTLQLVDGGIWRFYSSVGNSISCFECGEPIPLFSEFLLLSDVIGPDFILAVTDSGDPFGYFRIVDFNQQPVPEPATLLLLGAGLGGVALKRRRRR